MRRFLLATLILILVVPLFSFFSLETSAVSDLAPFTPHEIKVLVVSPANTYYSGAHYLISDLARYGFNITHHASDDALATNYLTDSKTSNLAQYDVVILHGILGFPPSRVSIQGINHFTNYNGTLVVMGNSLLRNETGAWWDSSFSTEPILKLEKRLGVDFTDFLGEGGAWHNSGTFTLTNSSIKGLPLSLSYVSPFEHNGSISFQLDLTTNGASNIYDFNITSSPHSRLIGKTTSGVTYYQDPQNGAVGIYVQGAYIYATSPGTNLINYFGLTDISNRSALLASLIAFALEKDVFTVIKPQPLANVRLDSVGKPFREPYLNASLSNFISIVENYIITPTVAFTDFLDFPGWTSDYWRTTAPQVLSQLESKYREWEYSTSLRYYTDPRLMTKEQIEALLGNIMGNYSRLGMDLFSTVVAPRGLWNQSTLDAMASKNLYLIDILDTHYSDWWHLRVNSSIIVHSGTRMLPEQIWNTSTLKLDWAENFTQPGLDPDSIHSDYFSRRDEWALAVVNGFPSFVYYVPNFRRNEVGTYSLRTVWENLTSEFPDIRFVPLMEAGLYFGNKWMRIENASRVGSVIEFDVDASAIPIVTSIEKGMLWLRINANESIQEVSIDDNEWFYFDDHSIRMPANSSHVKVTLGASPSPRVVGTRYKVVEARYDGYRFSVSVFSAQGLNVSVSLFLPQVGPFLGGNWSISSKEAQWSYDFDNQSRILDFWAISDGFVTFTVGVFFSVEQTPPWYDSRVTVTVNITHMPTGIENVTLSYYVNSERANVTMRFEEGVYVADIPMMPYGTVVDYRVFVLDNIGQWVVTEIFRYDVIDQTPPEVGVPTWNPPNPNADESVSVNASVTEPENASGVGDVVLWYYLNNIYADAKSVNMTRENDVWSAVIPGQTGGASVNFYVRAYDKAGNMKQTVPYSYQVAEGSALPFQIVLLGVGLGSVIGVGMILYFVKFRKTKHAN